VQTWHGTVLRGEAAFFFGILQVQISTRIIYLGVIVPWFKGTVWFYLNVHEPWPPLALRGIPTERPGMRMCCGLRAVAEDLVGQYDAVCLAL
jgi:hypothetical protein